MTARDSSTTGLDLRDRVDALTGLRFLAAASILITHTANWTAPFNTANPVSAVASVIGVYGMPLFFVLSGFVIHYNYAGCFASGHGAPPRPSSSSRDSPGSIRCIFVFSSSA